MRRTMYAPAAAVLVLTGVATAQPRLQLDVNSIRVQARDAGGASSAFGGVGHTGSLTFSFQAGSTALVGVSTQLNNNAPVNQNFSGSLTGFTGTVNLTSGMVTGGSLAVNIAGGDSYTAGIAPNAGAVSTFVGGGFKVEGLTFNGMFTDAQFGNVNIAPWFNSQSFGGLLGSFLQFNFDPDAGGAASTDMDIFVQAGVIPLPPAAWIGLSTLAGLVAVRRLQRRWQAPHTASIASED